MPFHEIMAATREGRVDAGVIIHESRFTYPRYGLRQVVDLGEWWEGETGHPIPLGGIVMRRDLGPDLIRATDRALAASVAFARASPARAPPPHAPRGVGCPPAPPPPQEMEAAVIRHHIALSVNAFPADYGPDGEAALRSPLETAERRGVTPPGGRPLFV